VFEDRRKTGRLDLEATEMAMRSALHRAGAAALSQLLEFPAPLEEERTLPCSCGQQAHYRGLRSKTVLTALGWVEVWRPYYGCPHCGQGQFPVDVELDIENTEFSPGVRRMMRIWAEPFTALRIPKLYNLRTDPFERADITSNTYYDWFINHIPNYMVGMALIQPFIESFKEFPPVQKSASYTLDDALNKMAATGSGGPRAAVAKSAAG
jgi:hypothetical protein